MAGAQVSPGTTLVVLLGASEWPLAHSLSGSPSFARSAHDFREYMLADTGFALPAENLLDLFDSEHSPSQIDAEIARFLEARTSALRGMNLSASDLLLYYVGHGGFTGRGHDYYLAIRSTREDSEGISSVRITDLADTLQKRARNVRRFLILDSCFAGSAYKEFQAAPLSAAREKTLDVFPVKGTALLCSSGARDPSLAPIGAMHTMFSGALIDVLRQGEPGGTDALSLAEIGHRVKNVIRERYPDENVRPEVHSPDQREGDIASIPLFPNAAVRARRLEQQLSEVRERLDAIEATRPTDLEDRLARVEATLATISSELESAHGVGAQVSSLTGAVATLREELALKHDTGLGVTAAADVMRRRNSQFFGVEEHIWREIPPNVRLELTKWEQARFCGRIWLGITVSVCGLGWALHIATTYLSEPGGQLSGRLAQVFYFLIAIAAIGSLLAAALIFIWRRKFAETEPSDGWWERLDPVVTMRGARLSPFFGSLQIAHPFGDIATIVYSATALGLTLVRYVR